MSLLINGVELLYELDTRYDIGCEVTARRVWQQLFNCYRMFDGDMNNLDNLLIDYNILEDYFGKFKNFEIAWYMSHKYYDTRFVDVTKYENDEQMDACNCGDIRLKIRYDQDNRKVFIELTHLD